jgi:nucleotide-binding universal stress UspA family protein
MLRSILLALDDTPGALAARAHAIALAGRTGAALTCAAVLDRPHTLDAAEPIPPGGMAFAERRNAALAARLEAEAAEELAAARAAAGALAVTPLLLEDAPEPALLRAGAVHDLVVMGRDATLGREETDDGLAPCAEALLRDGARPLLLVPPRLETGPVETGPVGTGPVGPVLVAYDGGMPAMRVLQLFALLGLAEGSAVRVVSVQAEAGEARRLTGEAAAFLRSHGVVAEECPVVGGHPATPLLAAAGQMQARMLVMGAFGTSGLRTWLLGSTTRRLLREAPCPVFVHH